MTIWRGKAPLVLASQSRARQMLLDHAGLAFEAAPADIDERAIQQKSGLLQPGEIAALLAQEKALYISAKLPDRYVVGADQTLALGTRLFSKPAGRAQAAEGAGRKYPRAALGHCGGAWRQGAVFGGRDCAHDHAAAWR